MQSNLCVHTKYENMDKIYLYPIWEYFILTINDKNEIAVSWWVSPKRTRSYPYARVYDTLGFAGKKLQ